MMYEDLEQGLVEVLVNRREDPDEIMILYRSLSDADPGDIF
jgi:hypothetical protein